MTKVVCSECNKIHELKDSIVLPSTFSFRCFCSEKCFIKAKVPYDIQEGAI